MNRGDRKPRPSIIDELNEFAIKENKPRDAFWARMDTLCQLTAEGTNRGDRIELLREAFPKWLNLPFDERLVDRYDRTLMAGVYYTSWSKRRYIMLQIASLGAKILWSDAKHANTTWLQMFEICIEELRKGYDYEGLDSFGRSFIEKELREMLRRYTDRDNKCREIVRSFFIQNVQSYEVVLDRLTHRINYDLKRERKSERKEEVKAALVEVEADVVETPVIVESVKENKTVDAAHSEEFLQIMERLNYMERSLARISRNVDEFDDDACGLCRFVERTASYIYSRPLSRLYDLYINMPEKVSGSELKVILDMFFYALQTLDIDPIDAQRLEKDYPEEYSEELAGRGGKPYRFSLCGWSYKNSMVIAPKFEEER